MALCSALAGAVDEAQAQTETVYRTVDAKGRVVYSNKPPEKGKKHRAIVVDTPIVPDTSTPSSTVEGLWARVTGSQPKPAASGAAAGRSERDADGKERKRTPLEILCGNCDEMKDIKEARDRALGL